eukprot:360723-Chlamydomonas_euryale.AAC.3
MSCAAGAHVQLGCLLGARGCTKRQAGAKRRARLESAKVRRCVATMPGGNWKAGAVSRDSGRARRPRKPDTHKALAIWTSQGVWRYESFRT